MRLLRSGYHLPVGRRCDVGDSPLTVRSTRTTLRKRLALVRSGPPYERLTGRTSVAAVNEADDLELSNDSIARARDAKDGRRSRSDFADVLCWAASRYRPDQ